MMANHARASPVIPAPPTTTVMNPVPIHDPPPNPVIETNDPMDTKGLDELIRFINGTEEQKELSADKSMSTKAAKRARQKQRKVQ